MQRAEAVINLLEALDALIKLTRDIPPDVVISYDKWAVTVEPDPSGWARIAFTTRAFIPAQ